MLAPTNAHTHSQTFPELFVCQVVGHIILLHLNGLHTDTNTHTHEYARDTCTVSDGIIKFDSQVVRFWPGVNWNHRTFGVDVSGAE